MRVNSLSKLWQLRFGVFCCAASLVVMTAGCAEAKRETAMIEGVVTLGGEPLADVEVVFLPDHERGTTGSRASALTDAQGYYALSCDRAGRIGTVTGYHRVCVKDSTAMMIFRIRPEGYEAPMCQCNGARIPTEYASASRTPLRIEVGPGRQTFDLDIQPDVPD